MKLTTCKQSQFVRDFFFLVKLQGAMIKSSHLTGFFFLIFQPRGCGILEFGSEAEAKQACDKMHHYVYKGRELQVYMDGAIQNR